MPFRSNNPITRDELLSRFFPQFHPVTTFNSGLSGGSFLIEHQGQRFVVRQPHDPDAPQSAFLRQYRALSQLPACIAPKPHLYLRDWMVVDYLPGAVKTYLPDTNELAGLLYYLHQQPRFGWRITLLPLLELYWQQSDPADSGLAANVKTSAQSAGTTAFTLKSIAYGCPRRKFSA